jgi:beta-alanine degradation protein BauB
MCEDDPTRTDPDKYRTLLENELIRVLEYRDRPGAMTATHRHPDSVMYTLSAFRRRLHVDGAIRDVELPSGQALWLPAQDHRGENIGSTDTHVLFVELKHPTPSGPATGALGPVAG